MQQFSLTLPIYWVEERKTKANKTSLLGMNWYHNTNPFTYQKAKKAFTELVLKQLPSSEHPIQQFKVHYSLYYKNSSCDGSNVIALIEKVLLDALQHGNIIANDSVRHHLHSSWTIADKDADNPRCEIIIEEYNDTPNT